MLRIVLKEIVWGEVRATAEPAIHHSAFSVGDLEVAKVRVGRGDHRVFGVDDQRNACGIECGCGIWDAAAKYLGKIAVYCADIYAGFFEGLAAAKNAGPTSATVGTFPAVFDEFVVRFEVLEAGADGILEIADERKKLVLKDELGRLHNGIL